jgi:23S rRNA (cytidine1920-2'-O)/16S rRNA (cytidine1409-2'-O)-methyltransferase
VHQRVCQEVRDWLESISWKVLDFIESPIRGPEGNVEFLIGAERRAR